MSAFFKMIGNSIAAKESNGNAHIVCDLSDIKLFVSVVYLIKSFVAKINPFAVLHFFVPLNSKPKVTQIPKSTTLPLFDIPEAIKIDIPRPYISLPKILKSAAR